LLLLGLCGSVIPEVLDSVFPSVKVSEIVELFGRYFQIGIHEKNLEVSTLEETMNKKKSAWSKLTKGLLFSPTSFIIRKIAHKYTLT
jgi:hypothetical protein